MEEGQLVGCYKYVHVGSIYIYIYILRYGILIKRIDIIQLVPAWTVPNMKANSASHDDDDMKARTDSSNELN